MADAKRPKGPLALMAKLNTHIGEHFLGGPRFIKQAWVINLQKGGTLPFVLALMAYNDNFSLGAWVYAALHGSYGLIWLLKHVAMPDPKWESKATFGSAIAMFTLVLGPYWLAPIILTTGWLADGPIEVSPTRVAVCTLIYAVGVVIMMVADAQKHFTLKVKRGLITTGMFARIRHPNYLGEMMIYGAFASLVGHWLPWVVLAWVWGNLFASNIYLKECSMSRYDGWAAYKKRSGYLLPWL